MDAEIQSGRRTLPAQSGEHKTSGGDEKQGREGEQISNTKTATWSGRWDPWKREREDHEEGGQVEFPSTHPAIPHGGGGGARQSYRRRGWLPTTALAGRSQRVVGANSTLLLPISTLRYLANLKHFLVDVRAAASPELGLPATPAGFHPVYKRPLSMGLPLAQMPTSPFCAATKAVAWHSGMIRCFVQMPHRSDPDAPAPLRPKRYQVAYTRPESLKERWYGDWFPQRIARPPPSVSMGATSHAGNEGGRWCRLCVNVT